jgi:hypothetical protein
MNSANKAIINEAYVASLNGVATEEQKLIWNLANAIREIRMAEMVGRTDLSRRIMSENDYTVGTDYWE